MTDVVWNDDKELFQLFRDELYTPVVGDMLDKCGCYHQFLPQPIQPLRMTDKVIGRAMPVLVADVHGPQKKPFGYMTEALDQLQEGEVYMASGGGMRSAYWGELLTVTARLRKANGAVVNGFHRDTPQVLEQGWPVFSRGRFAQDSSVRSIVADYRCAIEIEGVWIEPGDLIFGDLDGVLVIPQQYEKGVVRGAITKARGEKVVRKAIEDGMSATAAFATFGIL